MGSGCIPILMYHDVTPQPAPGMHKYAVTPEVFGMHMNYLACAGYSAITLDALLAHRTGRGTLPPLPTIITFDDGYQGCHDHAAPILRQHGFTAVFFLVAGMMGKTSRWLLAERGFESPLMDWAAARDLEASGFHCGSHTMSHSRLALLPEPACRDELLRSRSILEDGLGHPILHLAYPYGSFHQGVRALAAEAGYASACSVRIGLSPPDDDFLALHRIHIAGRDSVRDLRTRLAIGRAVRDLPRFGAGHIYRLLRRAGKKVLG